MHSKHSFTLAAFSALVLSLSPVQLQATTIEFDSTASAGSVNNLGDQTVGLENDWSFTTFADIPLAALGAGNSQIMLEVGGLGNGTTIGMINGSIAFTAGRGDSPIAEDLLALKPGDFGNSIVAFFRRTGDTYRAAIVHADGTVTDGGDMAGTPGGTTMGTNDAGVGGIASNFFSTDAGESQFAGLSNGDFAGQIRATAMGLSHQIPGVAQASTLEGVQSTAAFLDTAIVESIVQASDDLNNNATYTAADTFHALQMAIDHELTADYDVEHDGSAGMAIDDGSKTLGTIAAGTRVNAYMLRHDSDSDDTDITEMSITFDTEILGLNGGENASGGENHATSFSQFNLVGATEPTGLGTFNFNAIDLIINISPDRRTLHIMSQIGNSVSNNDAFDQLWVVTAAVPPVPEPATLGTVLLGLGGLVLRRRRN